MAYTVPQEKYEGRTQHKSALEAELIRLNTKLVHTFCRSMLHCMLPAHIHVIQCMLA